MAELPTAAPGCAGCGRVPADEQGRADGEGRAGATVPWTWSRELEHGRQLIRCPQCVRADARSIEARLDEIWWD